MGGLWLKALIAMIIGRALWSDSSNAGASEQSTQDHEGEYDREYDREYDQGYDEGYHDGHEEGFHEHEDPEFFDDDFFK